MKTVVFRQSCIYGTRQFGIEDQGWVAWFCVAVADGSAVHDLRRRQADPRRPLGRRPDRRLRAGPGPDRRGFRARSSTSAAGPANTLSLRELVAKLEREFGRSLDPPCAAGGPAINGSSWPTSARPSGCSAGVRGFRSMKGSSRLIRWVKENPALLFQEAAGSQGCRDPSVRFRPEVLAAHSCVPMWRLA